MENIRLQRGQEIAQIKDTIKRIDEFTYVVKSQSNGGSYNIHSTELGWKCDFPDNVHRGVKCKHIYAVEVSFALRREVQVRRIEPITNTTNCIFCSCSNIVKFGIRHNNGGGIQKYRCNDCKHYFSINLGFEKMHASPQMITSALQLYFTGESLRNVERFLKLQGVNSSHMSVYRWIKKYVLVMRTYLEKIKPNVSSVWRTDELYLKIKGNTKYLYAMMDDQTRFIIAQQVADTKNTTDIRPMFSKAKEITGTRPNVLISDGGPNFHDAFNKEFRTIRNPRTRHIKHVRLQGDHNNNKMEHFNGEVRDREKVMRGLKRTDTPILTGYQIYHNYM